MAAPLIRTDSSEFSTVAVCTSPGCSWRIVRANRAAALGEANTHRSVMHVRQASKTAHNRRRRS